jgi:hypothetical protein
MNANYLRLFDNSCYINLQLMYTLLITGEIRMFRKPNPRGTPVHYRSHLIEARFNTRCSFCHRYFKESA